jgi:secretion/DNA translocation related TadE-like protein
LGGTRRLSHFCDDQGSASIWLLGIGLAVVLLGAGLAFVGSAGVVRHRAEVAADLAALAGAERALSGVAIACRRAGVVAAANSGQVVACRLDDYDAIVAVSVSFLGMTAVATSRAGPA